MWEAFSLFIDSPHFPPTLVIYTATIDSFKQMTLITGERFANWDSFTGNSSQSVSFQLHLNDSFCSNAWLICEKLWNFRVFVVGENMSDSCEKATNYILWSIVFPAIKFSHLWQIISLVRLVPQDDVCKTREKIKVIYIYGRCYMSSALGLNNIDRFRFGIVCHYIATVCPQGQVPPKPST